MKAIVLENIGQLKIKEVQNPIPGENEVLLKVLYCALCRTDAKMWDQGQRDLVLPRTLGHEICGVDEKTGKKYVVWPGIACDKCTMCQKGIKNLCDKMQVYGFHCNGGLAEYIAVSKDSLIPVPEDLPEEIACMAEPIACSINALKQAKVADGKKVLIYGAGFVGLTMGLAARFKGAVPFIIENNPEKLKMSLDFRNKTGIEDASQYPEMQYDAVINTAPVLDTFTDGIKRVSSGGYYCIFSGYTSVDNIPVSLLNDIHYRQLKVVGAYGCLYKHMKKSLKILSNYQNEINLLVEQQIEMEQVPQALERILTEKAFKSVVKI